VLISFDLILKPPPRETFQAICSPYVPENRLGSMQGEFSAKIFVCCLNLFD